MHFIYTSPNILMPFLKNILNEILNILKQNNLINDYLLVKYLQNGVNPHSSHFGLRAKHTYLPCNISQ